MSHPIPRLILLVLIFGLWGCAPLPKADLTPTPTITPITPSPVPAPTLTPTTLACLSQPGEIELVNLDTKPIPLQFRVYLPPCYREEIERRYPVLYLLHGQTYTDDQWVRLGATETADRLIVLDEVPPFIIVMPFDRSWSPSAGEFGQALIDQLIPYIDATYRTLSNREQRTIGGLSRGAAWAIRLGLTRWDLFGAFGAHSPAIFRTDGNLLGRWLEAIPTESWPRIFIDIGNRDKELGFTRRFENMLTQHGVPHEWHLFNGEHDEAYWGAHVEEYIRWYAAGWRVKVE